MNKSLFKYILALLLFGSNGIVASLISLSSYEIVMYRTLIGSLLLILLYLLRYKRFTFYKAGSSSFFLFVSGICMGVSWIFLYEAYQQIGVSIASLGYYCGPVIVMALSPLLFHEKLTRQKLLGFAIVFAGIILVNANALYEQHTGFGIFCSLMSAVMYAGMVSFNKKATAITGMENSTLQLTVAFLSVFAYTIIRQGLHFHIQTGDIMPLLFLGIVNTGIGCYQYFSSIGDIKIQTVAIMGYLEPLSAVVLSVLLLKESMIPIQIAGAACIILGAIYAEFKGKTTSI